MSKGGSGLFKGANGSTIKIWDDINPTEKNYGGTELPRSFTIKVNNNIFWVHGNATEHIAEYLVKQAKTGHNINSTRLSAQLILSDMQASLATVTKDGIKYKTPLSHGNWEFVIKQTKDKSKNDSVIHAFYKK
jgi:hypothetical protein